MTAVDDLTTDIAVEESPADPGDLVDGQQSKLTSSHEQLHAPVPALSATVDTFVSESPADDATSIQNKVQDPIVVNSSNIPEANRQASMASTSFVYTTAAPPSHNTMMLGNTTLPGNPTLSVNSSMSGNTTMLGNSPQTMTVHEYCQAFEQWAWQYYWWMQHVQWMTWMAHMSTPMYPTAPCIPSTGIQSASQTVTSTVPAARQQRPAEQQQTQQPRGRSAFIFQVGLNFHVQCISDDFLCENVVAKYKEINV